MRTPVVLSAAAILAALPACSQACCPRPCERPVAGPVPAANPPAQPRDQVLATLESKRVKGLVFQEANLDQVVTYLHTVSGVPFHITPRVRATKYEDVKITLGPLDDVVVRQVLDLVTAPNDLRWDVKDGVVVIGTKDEVVGALQLRLFDVKDLEVPLWSFDEPPADPRRPLRRDATFIAFMIRKTIEPESWSAPGAGLEAKNGILIARNTARVLDEVGALLDKVRESAARSGGSPPEGGRDPSTGIRR